MQVCKKRCSTYCMLILWLYNTLWCYQEFRVISSVSVYNVGKINNFWVIFLLIVLSEVVNPHFSWRIPVWRMVSWLLKNSINLLSIYLFFPMSSGHIVFWRDGFQFTISSVVNMQSINFRAALLASGCNFALVSLTGSTPFKKG